MRRGYTQVSVQTSTGEWRVLQNSTPMQDALRNLEAGRGKRPEVRIDVPQRGGGNADEQTVSTQDGAKGKGRGKMSATSSGGWRQRHTNKMKDASEGVRWNKSRW